MNKTRRIIVKGSVLLAWAAGMAAATAQVVPQAVPVQETTPGRISDQQRHFAFGVTIREGYDSNVNTSEKDPVDSFISTIGPDLHFAWSSPTTDVAVHYVYWATYYEHRPGGNSFDQSHDFTFDVSHEFSPRFRVNMVDQFTPGFEPELDEGNTQRQGDYITNRLMVNTAYTLGGRWEMPVTFNHYYTDYLDSEVSEVMDRQSFTGHVGLRYNWRPQTRFGFGVWHEVNSYQGVNRNSRSEGVDFTVNHAFTPRLSMDLSAGASARFFEEQGETEFNPEIRVGFNYAMSPRTVFTGQFTARTMPTEVVQYLQQRSYVFMLGVAHQFTSRLTAGANVLYMPTEYDKIMRTPSKELPFGTPPGTQDGHEDTVSTGVNLSYQFNLHWRAELGATYSTVSSDFGGRSYDRGMGYIQTRIGF